MKKLLRESLVEFVNEEETEKNPLSNFKDVLVSKMVKLKNIDITKAEKIVNSISKDQLKKYDDRLAFNETTIEEIIKSIS